MSTPIVVYGAYWCPDCRRSKRFLSEHQIAYTWVDIEQDKKAQAYVEKLNNGKRIIPTIVFEADGDFLVEPSNAQLAQKLGLATRDPHDFHDVTIIGAGPARRRNFHPRRFLFTAMRAISLTATSPTARPTNRIPAPLMANHWARTKSD
jgi:glutaredoxin-like protein